MAATEALAELWMRFSSASRRLLSSRWRAELRLRARFDLAPIDPERVADEVPPGAVPNCPDCPDNCCFGWENQVTLRLQDLATLIDLDRTDLVQRQKPRFPREVVERRPHLQTRAAGYLYRSLPVLRQVGPERRCGALTLGNRCGLHPHWPRSCARFPYALSSDRRRLRWGTRCPSRHPERQPEAARKLRAAALDAYQAQLQDAVLLVHARDQLDAIGLGPWLIGEGEDPYEPFSRADRLRVSTDRSA